MPTVNPVFEKTYKDYLKQIAAIDPTSIEQILGVRVEGREITIPLFGIPHKVSEKGIVDPSGRQPSLDICVILCRYILLCPGVEPKAQEWVSFRDFKDSGPLTVFFLNDVERAIANCLTGNLDNMKKEVLQQLEKIHNAEVCFDKSDSDRSTKGKSTPTAVAKASSKARSGKSK